MSWRLAVGNRIQLPQHVCMLNCTELPPPIAEMQLHLYSYLSHGTDNHKLEGASLKSNAEPDEDFCFMLVSRCCSFRFQISSTGLESAVIRAESP